MRAGQNHNSALLVSRGAPDDSTDIDRFIGACMRADRSSAEQILVEHPDLSDRLTDDDRGAVVEAAGSDSVAAVGLMLDLGFSPRARDRFGEQPLHSAAYAGNADMVRLLIDAGADVDGRDVRFDSTPLTFATVGSGEHAGPPANWTEVVRLLIDAGASRDGVWIGGKPPSAEVAELLRDYGISPDDEPAPEPDDEDGPRPSLGTGVMADMARHLEAAYRDVDLELLGSLLHPEVHWSGVCHNRTQVLDWYRNLVADGLRSTIESVEVDGDAVVLGLSVGRRAEGPGRPHPSSSTRYLRSTTPKSSTSGHIPIAPARSRVALLKPTREPRGDHFGPDGSERPCDKSCGKPSKGRCHAGASDGLKRPFAQKLLVAPVRSHRTDAPETR